MYSQCLLHRPLPHTDHSHTQTTPPQNTPPQNTPPHMTCCLPRVPSWHHHATFHWIKLTAQNWPLTRTRARKGSRVEAQGTCFPVLVLQAWRVEWKELGTGTWEDSEPRRALSWRVHLPNGLSSLMRAGELYSNDKCAHPPLSAVYTHCCWACTLTTVRSAHSSLSGVHNHSVKSAHSPLSDVHTHPC